MEELTASRFTGNGWAAAGMMRVLATILNSDYASEYEAQTANLTDWIVEIVEASFAVQPVRSLPSVRALPPLTNAHSRPQSRALNSSTTT